MSAGCGGGAQAKAVESSAVDLPALLYDLRASDRQLLESLRMELIRVIALNITGYEAPLLKSGIEESHAAMEAVEVQLRPYLDASILVSWAANKPAFPTTRCPIRMQRTVGPECWRSRGTGWNGNGSAPMERSGIVLQC
jgi:hypothetical protein